MKETKTHITSDYNGMERIASRLGEQNLSISTHDPELQDRKDWQDSLIRKSVVEITGYEFLPVGEEQNHEDPKPVFELPVIGISNLLPSADGIFYYHPNHLGSTCYVTDENASVVQGFLYAPFGEITNEYNAGWQSGVLPKYSFNAKELDEETGMYYYEARYYQPPTFTSRDPLFEKYPTFSPYTYCANNPVKFIDPDGRKFGDPPMHHEFLISVGVLVYNSSKDKGASSKGAIVVLSQAILESGWGKTARDYGDFNLFGLMGSPSKRETSHGQIKDYSDLGGYSGCIADYFARAESLWPTWKNVLAQEEFSADDIDKALNTGKYFPTKEERNKGKLAYNADIFDGKNNYGERLINQINSTKKRFINSLKYQIDDNDKRIKQSIPYTKDYIDLLKKENEQLNLLLNELE